MSKPMARCPYCKGEHFHAEAVRADAVDPANPEQYAKVFGHWFNQCFDCGGWSVHRDGRQFKLKNKSKKPKKNSEPAL